MDDDLTARARKLLTDFTGGRYAFGLGVIDRVGDFAASFGRNALVVANRCDWFKPVLDPVLAALKARGVALAGDRVVPDAAPNAPREDVYRIATYILNFAPDCLVAVGGGSTIDAVKAANVLASLGRHEPQIEPYFGTGLVSAALQKTGLHLRPLVAVESAASSGAHLTKYANVTDPVAGQKMLIVDEAIVPPHAVFDYAVTKSMPRAMTIDGAFDGIAHCLEVFYGIGPDQFDLAREIAAVGIELVVSALEKVVADPLGESGREALGLATDLGGYAIMTGGTNGAHLTSFSLVDIASHGRGCALMNPYYTVFFAPAIERQLRLVGEIYRRHGYIEADLDGSRGRALGEAVARGMLNLSRRVGFPTTLRELPGFTEQHIERALAAAKAPQLEMKLKNMPVPLHASSVDKYMRPILEAAKTGDFGPIVNME